MPLATKNNAIIVKDGKVAESCGCCGGCYASFEWIDDPPPTSAPADKSNLSYYAVEAGFCACYWKPSVQLTCNFYDYRELYLPRDATDPLKFGGYLPIGGTMHSRFYASANVVSGDVVDRPTKSGLPGSFSGTAARVNEQFGTFGNGIGLTLNIGDGPGSILLVAQKTLWIRNSISPIPVQIGRHESANGDNVFEGETIANSFTGGAGYRYKVKKSDEQSLRSGIDATLARSLKDCDSAYFWSEPWTAKIQWDDAYSISSYWIDPNTFPYTAVPLGGFSADLTASTPVQSDNSQPLGYRTTFTASDAMNAPLRQWFLGSANGAGWANGGNVRLSVFVAPNAAAAPYEYGGQFEKHTALGGPACNGCQTRYGIYGVVARSYIVKRTNPYTAGSYAVLDVLYFDDVLSPCFNKGSSNEFEIKPNRRTISGVSWAGGYPYSDSGGGSTYRDFSGCKVTIKT